MNVRVAHCACMTWVDGQLVWDDYLTQRQLALTEKSATVLWHFTGWRELQADGAISVQDVSLAGRLLDAGVLIAQGSPEHQREMSVLAAWQEWGLSAKAYHFASRTTGRSMIASMTD